MSNLQTYYHFKLDFQKVDQHAGSKWIIHGTKRVNNIKVLSNELIQETIFTTAVGYDLAAVGFQTECGLLESCDVKGRCRH